MSETLERAIESALWTLSKSAENGIHPDNRAEWLATGKRLILAELAAATPPQPSAGLRADDRSIEERLAAWFEWAKYVAPTDKPGWHHWWAKAFLNDGPLAAKPDAGEGLTYEERVVQVALALHHDCVLEWQAIGAVDPDRLVTQHMPDAHYGQAHNLVRRIWPELDAAYLRATTDETGGVE